VTAAELAATAQLLRAAENPARQSEACLFHAIGVGNADRAVLEALAPDSTIMLRSVRFRDILGIVSNSSENPRSSDEPGEAYRQARGAAEDFGLISALEEHYKDQ
jgi:hypothetical protein